MADQDAPESESTEELGDERDEKRRAFLKTAASVAVTTSAVTLMLSAGTKINRAAAMSPDGDETEDAATDDGRDDVAETKDDGEGMQPDNTVFDSE